jgi:hypothetical protein
MYYFYKNFQYTPPHHQFRDEEKDNWKVRRDEAFKKFIITYGWLGEELATALWESRPRFRWSHEKEVAYVVLHLLRNEASLLDMVKPYRGWKFHKVAIKAIFRNENIYTAQKRFKPFSVLSQPRLEEAYMICLRIQELQAGL